MDDIKITKSKRAEAALPTRRIFDTDNSHRQKQIEPAGLPKKSNKADHFNLDDYVRALKKRRRKNIHKFLTTFKKYFATTRRRVICGISLVILLLFIVLPALQEKLNHRIYALGTAESAVLTPTNPAMAKALSYDGSQGLYTFNKDYAPRDPAVDKGAGGALITAKLYQDPAKGIQITDPINKIDFTMKPLFDLGDGKQQENRLVFPTFKGRGHLVYTAEAVGIKEDITLQQYVGDTLSFSYQLELGDTYAARMLPDGGVGIYGSSLPLNGNVSTGSDKDAALLQKARQKAAKDKLLFTLPAPIIKETNKGKSSTQAKFTLKGDRLTVTAQHLKSANYPLTIDPTVTTVSATGLYFDADIETNVDIDTTNNLLKRGSLTGGNFGSWTASTTANTGNLNASHYLGSAAVYGGTLYVIGGASTTTTANLTGANYVEQAKINTDGSLNTLNLPTSGPTFTAGNATGLPAGGIARFQLLTYNGYLYIVDGITSFTSLAAGGTVSNAVYYTRVTSESYNAFNNGSQLKNWSTTTNKPSAQVYAYGAAVYNGYMYVAGGLNSAGTAQSAVLYAAILPSGDLGTFNTASASLPAARFGMDMQAYFGHLYVVGGNTGSLATAALTASVVYASIASDGSIAGTSWTSTNSLVNSAGTSTQGMENFGAPFSMVSDGYIYVTGACTSVASGTCAASSLAAYTQVAQVNADGSLGSWFPNGGGTSLTVAGTPITSFNSRFYVLGACSVTSTTTVSCSTTSTATNYAAISTNVGDISAKRTPTAIPTALMAQSTVVLNGFIYILGGCNTSLGSPYTCNGTRTANYKTSFALLGSDGSFVANGVASCPGGAATWCTMGNNNDATALHFDGEGSNTNCDTTGTFGSADYCGLEGGAAVIYNGFIYYIGGNDGNVYNGAPYYMQPNATTGLIAAWTKGANTISTAATGISAFAHNGSLYIMGGCNQSTGVGCPTGTASAFQTQVQRSVLNSSGVPGAWSALSGAGSQLQLTTGIGATAVTYYGGYVYLAGGITNATAETANVLRAKLNSSGDIVAATGATWAVCSGTMAKARRRAVSVGINGYLYVIGGHNGSDLTDSANGTSYGDIQIGKIDLASAGTGDIAAFTTSPAGTVTKRWNPAIAFSNGFMYVTGGCTTGYPAANCTAISTTTESFVVYNANNLGANTWNSQTNTYAATAPNPAIANRLGSGAVAYNGYLYVAGGCLTYTIGTTTCSLASTDMVYAPINADGTLGTWIASTALANLYAYNQLVALNGTLYLLTGQNSTGVAKSIVRYSVIGANGAPGTWTDSSNSLPLTRTQAAAVVYANRIYVVGGYDGTSNSNTVYYSPALSSPGDIPSAWTAATTGFTTARRELNVVTAGAYLYVLGGYDGTNYYSDVQLATPNTSTGDITSWSFVNELPYKQAGMSAVAANGYIYTFGGRNGVATTSCTNDTSFAAVNGNGTVSEWQQNPSVITTPRFGTGGGYYNGYFFITGGHDCTSIISANVIQQSGQLSQAMHATYSRYVDFGTDATFRQLYVLGTNAAISGVDIDRWKIIVKTSTSVNNSWGQKTNSTLTGLNVGPDYGTPITFQALDGSGVDQGAAQYWQITFDIDQSQSFGFPDGNQPSITKYDFYFSPGPGKRLRNGKTFINETQTTLDAHP